MRDEEPISISLSDVKPLIDESALRDESSFNFELLWMPALGLVVLGAMIWTILWYIRRRQKLAISNDPANLFRELCTAHALTWPQRRTLLKLAQLRKIANPCLVILDAGLWPEEDDPLISRSLTNKLSELRRCLFQPIDTAS